MKRSSVLLLTLFFLSGCASSIAALKPGADRIRVGKGDAPVGFLELGPISVISGAGCGVLGTMGSYESAYAKMRNAALGMGASYVRLDMTVGPHLEGDCYDNTFALRGVAFRDPSGPPTSSALASPGTSPSVPTLAAHTGEPVVGEMVVVWLKNGNGMRGMYKGTAPDGSVQIELPTGAVQSFNAAEVTEVVRR